MPRPPAGQAVADGARDRLARRRGRAEPAASAPALPEAIARIDLERAIAQLPDGCRAAFVLHDVEGLDHREVGAALGISEGTSKSQVHKARMKLRVLLRGLGAVPRGALETV